MNISKYKNQPIYKCDKCGKIINFGYRKGRAIIKYYKVDKSTNYPIKAFDLCEDCNKELQKWLKEIIPIKEKLKEISTYYIGWKQ